MLPVPGCLGDMAFGPTANLCLKRSPAGLLVADAEVACSNVYPVVAFGAGERCAAVLFPGRQLRVFFEAEQQPELLLQLTAEDELMDAVAGEILMCAWMDDGELLLILADGAFYRGRVEEGSLGLVGAIANGLSAVAWSPDGDVLCMVTASAAAPLLMLMSRDLEVLVEGPCQVAAYGSEEMISIGWGRKETQFHGSVGKQAALTRVQVTQALVPGRDDLRARITWRQDGQYFAVSSVDEGDGGGELRHRRMRVYSRAGELCCTSEPVEGLLGALAWRPNGQLLAACQYLPAQSKQQVVFFERNGLRHGEFAIDAGRVVRDLHWSADSNILAVQYEEPRGVVELWSCSNAHWYCKLVLPLPVARVAFDWEDGSLLTVTTSDNWVRRLKLLWSVTVSNSTIAVVDAGQVHITPLALCAVPPPMSLVRASGSDRHLSLALRHKGSHLYDLVSCSADGLVRWASVAVSAIRTDCRVSVTGEYQAPVPFVQLMLTPTGLFGNSLCGDVYQLTEGAQSFQPVALGAACECMHDGHLFLVGGEVVDAERMTGVASLARLNDWMWVLSRDLIVGLDDCGRFYANGKAVLSQVTSCAHTSEFLLLTSSAQHLLHFLSRSHAPESWWEQVAATGASGNEELSRRIERGATLVSINAAAGSVVLQMPRGNLETISPRAMVLQLLRKQLKSLDFGAAYQNARRHRIDLNFLYDFDPALFERSVGKFLADLGAAEHVNLFLSCLRDEDTTKSKYAGSALTRSRCSAVVGKVNRVVGLLLPLLLQEPGRYVESVMTAHVVHNPPQLEEALQCIVGLVTGAPDAATVEKSLKYLIFLVPPETLYDAALGMYNLPLALAIAKRSPTQDPKDYVPFLEALAGVDETTRRFQINDHLSKWDLALEHLAEMNDAERFVQYVQKHRLFAKALLLTAGRELQTRIYGLFAQHLEGSNPEAACVMHYRANNVADAIRMASGCGNYRLVCECLRGLEGNRRAEAIAATLSKLSACDCVEFALQLRLGEDVSREELLKLAVVADRWDIARGLGVSPSDLDAAIDGQVRRLSSDVAGLLKEFGEKSERMLKVQQEFLEDPNRVFIRAVMKNVASQGDLDDERLSEISLKTATTLRTLITTSAISSHSRNSSRKRQKLRDKPGSPQEREYLLTTLRALIERSIQLEKQVKDALLSVLTFNSRPFSGLGQNLSREFSRLVTAVKGFVQQFNRQQLPVIAYFNEKQEAIGLDGQIIGNPRIDPLDARFDIPEKFGEHFTQPAFEFEK